jgi:translocation and assembly module TamA
VFGLGHRVALQGALSSIEQDAGLIYSFPWMLSLPLETEFTGFYRRHDTLFFPVPMGYSGEFIGFGVGVGHTNVRGVSYEARFRYENVLSLSASSPEDLPATIPAKDTRSIGLAMTYDRRSGITVPTRGYHGMVSTELAGIFGASSNQFVKVLIGGGGYFDIRKTVVVGSGLRAGWVGPYGAAQGVPPQEKFFAGGPRSVRGYGYHQLVIDDAGNPRGGTVLVTAHVVEVRFPLPWWLYGAVFFDAGYVWSDFDAVAFKDLRYGAGPGLRVDTPIGLIRLDLGIKLRRREDESRVEFYLDVGEAF